MAQKDERGRAGEELAALHLADAGLTVVDRNWRCAQGELDIVAIDGDELVVVEVKTRRTTGYGHPFDAIDDRKRDRLWRLAHAWRAAHADQQLPKRVRVDVVGVVGPGDGLEHWRDLR